MTWYCNSDLILKELKMKGWLEKKTVELFNQSNAMTCDRVKAIRRSYRMTQEDFATVLNISFHTYKNWETLFTGFAVIFWLEFFVNKNHRINGLG